MFLSCFIQIPTPGTRLKAVPGHSIQARPQVESGGLKESGGEQEAGRGHWDSLVYR